MSEIKRVAVGGATGELGLAVVRELLAASYPVTILARTSGKLPSDLASHASLKEVVVDYDSPESLQSALTGIDAVVATFANNTAAPQKALIAAAEAAGVKRFLPSEFGSDLSNPVTRALPVFGQKVQVTDYLAERVAAGSKLTYTIVYNNAFLDWGLQEKFLLDPVGHKATLFDGGDFPVSLTRLSTVGKAVVGVLRHPEETKNRVVFVHDGRLSNKQLLEAARSASPGKEWTVGEESTEEVVQKSYEALGKGIMDQWVWVGFIYWACQTKAGGAGFEKTDNELLGVETLSEEELKAEIVRIVKTIPGAV